MMSHVSHEMSSNNNSVVHVVYHQNLNDIKDVISKLPVLHTFGDTTSCLQDGTIIAGTENLEKYMPRKMRVNVRTHIFHCKAHAFGGYGGCSVKKLYENPRNVILSLVAVPDWQTEDIDTFVKDIPDVLTIRVGSQYLWPVNYMSTMVTHFSTMFQALKSEIQKQNKKAYIKITPLAIGPTIQTRNGTRICNVVAPWYTQAVALAINAFVDSTWVDTIEFIDFCNLMSTLKAFLVAPTDVFIVYPSKRDVLDFRSVSDDLVAVSVCPVDSMSAPWKQKETACTSLASAALQNTNVYESPIEMRFKYIT